MDLKGLIGDLRRRIDNDYQELDELWPLEMRFEFLDKFIQSTEYSDLEKAFYLMLNQFPGDTKDYIIRPREMVLIPDVYDMGSPGIEYEIDFALYGGSIDNPVKVAIECDGLRSHRQKHNNKDRRKDVNLQASGWIVIRFGSEEIHDELKKFETDENHVSPFLYSIDNVIKEKLRIIDNHNYAMNLDLRSKLTGYKWGYVTCKHCGDRQIGQLNHKKHM
jgi:hypothetical protein